MGIRTSLVICLSIAQGFYAGQAGAQAPEPPQQSPEAPPDTASETAPADGPLLPSLPDLDAPYDDVPRMTLEACVGEALTHNRRLAGAGAEVERSEADRRSLRGQLGPVARVEGNVQVWDRELSFPAGAAPGAPADEELVVRERVTSNLRATLTQPIIGVVSALHGLDAQNATIKAARYHQQATAQDVTLAVTDAYLEALRAERLAAISDITVQQIEAHLANARAFEQAGMISRNEVLETEVRLAEAQAQAIQAHGSILLARSNLAFQMGLPADQPIAPAPIESRPVPETQEAYGTLADSAVTQRPDLRSAHARIEQAEAGVSIARSRLLPEVSLIGSYERTTGQIFALRNQFFVGGQLSWNIWDWGATYYGIDSASAQLRQARSQEDELREAVKLEVRQAHVRQDNARQQLMVAEKAVGQAEENVRIVESRFRANAATTTHVLDAQTLLARARVQQTTAHYDYLHAMAALRHAVGNVPVAGATRR